MFAGGFQFKLWSMLDTALLIQSIGVTGLVLVLEEARLRRLAFRAAVILYLLWPRNNFTRVTSSTTGGSGCSSGFIGVVSSVILWLTHDITTGFLGRFQPETICEIVFCRFSGRLIVSGSSIAKRNQTQL